LNALKLPFLTALFVLLASCSLFDIQPQNLSERLAIAYNLHTSVQESAANSLNAGDLSAEDGEQVLMLADESRVLLDATRVALSGGDTSTAEGKLNLSMSILSQLQLYIRSQ
jgi:hypothetical protein